MNYSEDVNDLAGLRTEWVGKIWAIRLGRQNKTTAFSANTEREVVGTPTLLTTPQKS